MVTTTGEGSMYTVESAQRAMQGSVQLLARGLCLLHREMSCCRPCPPRPCGPCGPTPLASSCTEPCLARCADSTVYIEPSPVVVTMPGPILTSFPQSTAVGSSLSAAVGSSLSTAGVPISSGGSLGLGASGLCLPLSRCGQIC
ncbi:feather keratin Cos1-1/Cos1-3/Cos2-1-like [Catharus ustulatus]|nr:feather keratin Cos1-1/Cos1-3/Cos2-1-like [Catharus ustulatus]